MTLLAVLTAALLSQTPVAQPPAHPPAPSPEELIKKLDATADVKTKDKTFDIASSLGRLYYGQGRFADAALFYGQAVAKAEPLRALYAAERKLMGGAKLPSAATLGCVPSAEVPLEALLDKARALAKAKNHAGAVSCARAGLHGLIEVDTMLGHARFLVRDVDGALAAYDAALATFESNPDARYARAAVLLDARGDDLKALERAKADFERFLEDYSMSPRAPQARRFLERTTAALAAGGLSRLKAVPVVPPKPAVDPHAPPQLTPEMMAALQSVKKTPELEAGFDKTIDEGEEHLARGRFDAALNSYRQVMPFQPENPRVRAGMAFTLVRLGKPTADRIWNVAMMSPGALETLGQTLRAKGDEEGAKVLFDRLAKSKSAP